MYSNKLSHFEDMGVGRVIDSNLNFHLKTNSGAIQSPGETKLNDYRLKSSIINTNSEVHILVYSLVSGNCFNFEFTI